MVLIWEVFCQLCPVCHSWAERLERAKQDIYSNNHIAPIAGCFNQMGSVTFLREQAALTRHPLEEAPAGGIRTVYREYFGTIQRSLQTVDKVLLQISKVVDETPPSDTPFETPD